MSYPVTGFSGFYLSTSADIILSVRLVRFDGVINSDHTVSLQWIVAEQAGIINYEVQKSVSGNNFATIGSVIANTLQEFTYRYNDLAMLIDNPFYRIKINDRNGRISYSQIIGLSNTANNSTRLYPVPAVNHIIIQTKDATHISTIVTIIDINGRTMKRQQLTTPNQYVDISSWAAGIYYVRLADGSVLKFQK